MTAPYTGAIQRLIRWCTTRVEVEEFWIFERYMKLFLLYRISYLVFRICRRVRSLHTRNPYREVCLRDKWEAFLKGFAGSLREFADERGGFTL